MKEPVVIKSYQMNGFKLVMDPSVPFEEILTVLTGRLKKNRKFFKNIPKGLLFEGRELSFEEQKKVLSCIRENSDMNIVCVIEDDPELQKKINEEVQKACLELEKRKAEEEKNNSPNSVTADSGSEDTVKKEKQDSEKHETAVLEKKEKPEGKAVPAPLSVSEAAMVRVSGQMSMEDPGLFYKGNLRSGQVLESDKSIILLGDIKPGANVISKGNVIVLGSLRGNVFAGADGNKDAFVVALDMQPVQVRIDDFIARSPDEPEKVKDKQAKIAFLEGENIYIEPVSREVFNDIRV